VSPSWHDVAFALPLAMLAYTGLETVANMAEEARRPGVDLPRALVGKSSIQYVNEADKEKPRVQQYKIFADAPIARPKE